MSDCPCGSGRDYADCCQLYIEGKESAPTAEAVMRARYTSFAVKAFEYLENTLTPESRTDYDRDHVKSWAESSDWQGLEIVSKDKGTADDSTGDVEFIATFKQGGATHKHHELSHFEKRDGEWFYTDGDIVRPQPIVKEKKVGRNEPCPCGSGKKYKKCCGRG